MKKNSKNVKEIELPLEFNPGLKKYEPTLPTRKTRKKLKVGIDWKWIIKKIKKRKEKKK